MSNMGHCRFENTYEDLRDCYENWEGVKNESETKYRQWLLELCQQIVEEYGNDH